MKKALFILNAKLLNEKLKITPLLYGSSGLEYLTGQDLNSDDIDILIPEAFVTDRWGELKKILENEGFLLIDEHEHTFRKSGVCYSYAAIEELGSFAGIKMSEISNYTEGDVQFKLLSLKQYLKVYEASEKDGYRINVRKKKDNEKIKFIKKQLDRGVENES